MNARAQVFELTLEADQTSEAVASLLHTVLFHRCTGKFHYSSDESYTVGSVGFTDVNCNFIDLTYVCCSSKALDKTLENSITGFSQKLRGSNDGSSGIGEITLEFFQKKNSSWIMNNTVPWEMWTVHVELIKLNTELERQGCRESVGELLSEKIINITEVMNRDEYVPQMPSQSNLDTVFDTGYPDVQPYLFNLNYTISGPSRSTSVGATMKKLFKETLAL